MSCSRTVEEVFRDFKGRRAGLIKAFTMEAEKVYQQSGPENMNLCLYGFPNETWELKLPVEMLPPELPEPALGINFARDGMRKEDWLTLVALHSDSWLLSVAYYFGGRFGFGRSERKRLFQMINDLPTLFEVVRGIDKQSKDDEMEEDKEEDEQGETPGGASGDNSASDEKAEHIECAGCGLGGTVKNLSL
ncbi:PHD finger protein Alfin1-like isoform X2 [Cornus florida]|nr:PHD finger protein Alfin1-like isoform X2 [Cornus florida]